MGATKKKSIKFIAKGHLAAKIKQRNHKKKVKALKEKRKGRFEKEDAGGAAKSKGKGAAADSAVPTHGGKKDESDMLNDMDVDDFLNDEFLNSEDESDAEDEQEENTAASGDASDSDDDVEMKDDAGDDSSSEEEDEDALDPRYMTPFPAFDGGDDAGDDDDDEESPEADADAGADAAEEEESVGRKTLTMELLIKAEKECFEQQSIGGLRRLMKIFSDACRSSDAADVSRAGEITYDIQSSAVYNRLMLNVFRKMHTAFARLVAVTSTDEDAADEDQKTAGLKMDDRKWKKHSLVIKRFFGCVTYVLSRTTGQDIQTFVLRELAHYLPFVVPCQKTASRLLRTLLKLWAKSLNNTVCMLAFVRIRDLALQMPFPFLELALKGIYITYMRNTKFTNEATLPHHVLLGNCVVELYGLDLASSYQHAFVYIRELAITLRKTITSPSPETFKAVLNWQFFNQLRVWTAVVCAYPDESQLRPLVYPLCQLLFAVVRLASTIRYAPMRFQCVKLLQQLAFATHSFVPTAPVLLEVLQMPPFSTSYRGSGKGKGGNDASSSTRVDLDLELAVKLSKSHLDHKRVHDLLISRLFELLQRECDVYKFHIGFPEFTVPLLLALSKFASTCLIPRWKSLARGLIENLKKRADWIRAKRSGLEIAPKDVDKMAEFLKTERQQAVRKLLESDAEAMQKKLAEAPKDDAAKAKAAAAAAAYNSDDSDDEQETPKAKVDEEEATETKGRKSKKKNNKKNAKSTVDDATFNKVKQMSLKEFKKSVAAVDAADVVEDMTFSSDEE
ncbi:hypothetical protein PINS_up004423 [Pythium insidiosum]|nr:hypothetical protein PINS_up004423 [Pythium insidiosum]